MAVSVASSDSLPRRLRRGQSSVSEQWSVYAMAVEELDLEQSQLDEHVMHGLYELYAHLFCS